MTILPKELTVIAIADQLGMTTKWVEMTLELLKFEGRQGRGYKRIFSPDEFRIFENVKLLRMCMSSWKELVEIRKREQIAKERINSYIVALVKQRKSGASTSRPTHPWVLNFILTEHLKPFRDLENVGDLRVLLGPAKAGIFKKIDRIFDECKVAEIKDHVLRKTQSRVKGLQRQLDVLLKYTATAKRFYKCQDAEVASLFSVAGKPINE